MPKWNPRRTQSAGIIKKRWSIEQVSSYESSEDDEVEINLNERHFEDDGENIDWTNLH
ncbi:unnamed protein product, partial [Rotaria socialis]